MAKFISRRAEIGIARETTRGTPVVPSHWIPWQEFDLGDRTERAEETSAMGRIDTPDDSFNTIRYAQGSITADVRAAYLGLILSNVFGAAPSSGAGPPYTHTYTLTQTNQHASLSMLIQDKTSTDIIKMFPLCMLNRYTLNVEAGQIVKNTMDFIGLDGRDWTSQSSAFTSLGDKFLHQHLEFKVAANLASLGAASTIAVRELELVIEKNVLRSDVAGTVRPDDINNQDFRVSGSISLNYEDSTWLDYMTGETDRAIEIILRSGTNGILTLRMPLVHFMWERDMPVSEIARQSIDFVCHYDAPNGNAVISTATLVNQVASY